MTNQERARRAARSELPATRAVVDRSRRRPDTTTIASDSALLRSIVEERETYAILAAIKPNDAEGAVLATAQWIAEHERRELHLVSIVETGPYLAALAAGVPLDPVVLGEEERQAIRRDLRAAHQRARHPVSRLRVDVLAGPVPDTIAELGREREVRLVVVGKGTHGRLSHLLHGERATDIIRRSGSPVLIVPPDLAVPIERAMVAFDSSMASVRAAVAAHELLGPGGRLTLVHVATPRRATEHRSQWWLRSLDRRTRDALEEFARTLPIRRGVVVDTAKVHGNPVDALTAYAQSHRMQLLACGWHGQVLTERLFGESVTSGLIHRVPCAVLVAGEPNHGGRDAAS